jgi:NitT/TauT family transport system permease protein
LPSQVTTPFMPEIGEEGNQPSSLEGMSSPRHTALTVLAPVASALAAILVHNLLPNRQSPLPTRLYPNLLGILLLASVLLAAAQWASRQIRPWVRYNAPLFAGAIFVLCLWDSLTLKLAWMPLPYFPGPDMVLQGLVDDRTLLWESTYQSLRLLLTGYSLGVFAGLISGVLVGWFRGIRYWGMPVLKTVGPIPATAYLPLAMILFANPFLSGSALIAVAVWFPVTMLTVSGIANVPVSYLDVARTLGARPGYLIFRVAIPSAMPNIFIGLFMGLGASFLALMAAETVGVKSGLGVYLNLQKGYAEYAKVYADLIIMAVFFSGIMTLLFKVRDRVLGWQKGVIRW